MAAGARSAVAQRTLRERALLGALGDGMGVAIFVVVEWGRKEGGRDEAFEGGLGAAPDFERAQVRRRELLQTPDLEELLQLGKAQTGLVFGRRGWEEVVGGEAHGRGWRWEGFGLLFRDGYSHWQCTLAHVYTTHLF